MTRSNHVPTLAVCLCVLIAGVWLSQGQDRQPTPFRRSPCDDKCVWSYATQSVPINGSAVLMVAGVGVLHSAVVPSSAALYDGPPLPDNSNLIVFPQGMDGTQVQLDVRFQNGVYAGNSYVGGFVTVFYSQ